MFGALRSLFVPKPPESATRTYIALVAQARNPFFYETLSVPDTLDGRFELIVLHLFLLQHRLRNADPAFAQFLSEAFFADMDRSLREIGVSDTGVSHRIKAMGKAYHGRLQAYTAGLAEPNTLPRALARNLYGTVAEGDIALLQRAAHYVSTMTMILEKTEIATLTSGELKWPTPESL